MLFGSRMPGYLHTEKQHFRNTMPFLTWITVRGIFIMKLLSKTKFILDSSSQVNSWFNFSHVAATSTKPCHKWLKWNYFVNFWVVIHVICPSAFFHHPWFHRVKWMAGCPEICWGSADRVEQNVVENNFHMFTENKNLTVHAFKSWHLLATFANTVRFKHLKRFD